MYRVSAILLLLLSFTACKKEYENTNGLKLVAFKPNQCNEPWDSAAYRAEGLNRAERLKKYLKDNGIGQVTNFEITVDNKIYCEACSCLSGQNIRFTVMASDFEKLKTIAPFSTYLK